MTECGEAGSGQRRVLGRNCQANRLKNRWDCPLRDIFLLDVGFDALEMGNLGINRHVGILQRRHQFRRLDLHHGNDTLGLGFSHNKRNIEVTEGKEVAQELVTATGNE